MSELVEDRITLKIQIESQREKLELSIHETAQHKDKSLMYEEEIRNLKGQLRNYTDLKAQYEEAKVVIGKNTEDQDALKAQINVKENEIVQLKVTISNLQRAMA